MKSSLNNRVVALAGLIALAGACAETSPTTATGEVATGVVTSAPLPEADAEIVNVLTGLPMPEDVETVFSANRPAGDTSPRFLHGIFVTRLRPGDLTKFFEMKLAVAGWQTEEEDARNGVFVVRHADGPWLELRISERMDGGYGSAFTVTLLGGIAEGAATTPPAQ